MATLALKPTCTLNLKPGNYLYLQRNGKIDFAIVMQQAATAGIGWPAFKIQVCTGTGKDCPAKKDLPRAGSSLSIPAFPSCFPPAPWGPAGASCPRTHLLAAPRDEQIPVG